jgi:hypothetical protein
MQTVIQPPAYDSFANDVASGRSDSDPTLVSDFWAALNDPTTTTDEKGAMLQVLYGRDHGTMDNKTAASLLVTTKGVDEGSLGAGTPPGQPPLGPIAEIAPKPPKVENS